jgi:hypothetical protein
MHNRSDEVTTGQARKTALIVAGVLLFISAIFWYRGNMRGHFVSAGLALILVFIGFLVPPAAKLFHRIWFKIAFALGWVNSRILLTIIYFLVFVPYRIVSRLAGRDPLNIRQPAGESYWHKREKTRQAKEQFERLF